MRILITNDDAIAASQLIPLVRWWQKHGQVTVVVPKLEQSGKSHGIEIHKDFEAKQVALTPDITAWAVDSTPADCVRFAILGLGMQFDLVISGINRGLNIGSDIMYSGTVSAVLEAVALGCPAIALSTPPEYYGSAVTQMDRVWEFFQTHRLLEKHPVFNVNIPAQPKTIRITHQGGPYYTDSFIPVGNDLYHPHGYSIYTDRQDDDLDTDAVMHGHISIMPLTMDKTDWTAFRALRGLNG